MQSLQVQRTCAADVVRSTLAPNPRPSKGALLSGRSVEGPSSSRFTVRTEGLVFEVYVLGFSLCWVARGVSAKAG